MSEDAQDRVKLDVRYVDVKRRARFFVNPTDKLDELKTKFDDFFIHIGSNHRTRDVIVNVNKEVIKLCLQLITCLMSVETCFLTICNDLGCRF